MATFRSKRKLAAMERETQENPRNNQSQTSAASGITEDYKAQISKEIEGRDTTKPSQQDRIPHFGCAVQVRRVSSESINTDILRNTNVEKQEPSGDRSQNDPYPEVEFSACRASNLTDSDPYETSHNWLSIVEINSSSVVQK